MNYPYTRCLNPRLITNPYNNVDMYVPCGECEVCAMMKSSFNTLKVQLENKSHHDCRFVTLTYSNTYIPRMRLVDNDIDDDKYPVSLYRYLAVDLDYGNVLFGWNNLESYQVLQRKCECMDLPFLRKYDLQLFIKRLRKYFDLLSKKKKKDYGKIRFYGVGELGPVHYRPHYHLLIWSEKPEVMSELPKAVRKAWRFGRVSTEIPQKDVSRYVAGYINGSVPLPSIFKQRETRPFSVHSQHLGESFLQTTKKEIYLLPYREIVRRSCFIAGSYKEFDLWRSLKVAYFPRCKKYDLLTSRERYDAYVIVQRLYQFYPEWKEETIASLTDKVLRDMRDYYERYGYIPIPVLADLAKYADIDFFVGVNEYYEELFRKLYMIIRLSKYFIDFVCDGDLFQSRLMLQKIEQFWKDDELYSLNKRYKNIEESTDVLFENEDEYTYMFVYKDGCLTNPHYTRTKVYKRFREESLKKYRDSMKHKELNDLNRCFENI